MIDVGNPWKSTILESPKSHGPLGENPSDFRGLPRSWGQPHFLTSISTSSGSTASRASSCRLWSNWPSCDTFRSFSLQCSWDSWDKPWEILPVWNSEVAASHYFWRLGFSVESNDYAKLPVSTDLMWGWLAPNCKVQFGITWMDSKASATSVAVARSTNPKRPGKEQPTPTPDVEGRDRHHMGPQILYHQRNMILQHQLARGCSIAQHAADPRAVKQLRQQIIETTNWKPLGQISCLWRSWALRPWEWHYFEASQGNRMVSPVIDWSRWAAHISKVRMKLINQDGSFVDWNNRQFEHLYFNSAGHQQNAQGRLTLSLSLSLSLFACLLCFLSDFSIC